jgi:hypothetical protein
MGTENRTPSNVNGYYSYRGDKITTDAQSNTRPNKETSNRDMIKARNLRSTDGEVNLNKDQSNGSTHIKNKRVLNNNKKQAGTTKYYGTATQKGSANVLPCSHTSGGSEPCVVDNALRAVQIKSVLMEVSDRFDLNDPESPQYQAAAWIIYGDPMRLSPTDPSLFQRYSAVVLYLATNGDQWYLCSANTTSPCGHDNSIDANNTAYGYSYDGCSNNTVSESKTKRELNKIKSRGGTRWLSGASECKWYGLQCNSAAFIKSIDLTNNNLSGELPPEIKTFCKATDIKMIGNKINGRLPKELGELNLLKNLLLGRNIITGEIPSTLYQLTTLERLDIHANKLSGCISTKMGKLKELRRLQLSQNLFTGTIPRQIGFLGKLSESYCCINVWPDNEPIVVHNHSDPEVLF